MTNPVIVEAISELEYMVGNNVTSLIEGNIIYVIANGEQTDEIAQKQFEVDHILEDKIDGKKNYLINLNNCGKNSPVARAKWNESAEEESTNKVAIFGIHPVAKVIAAFVMKISKKKNQRFFKTKEEALQWLKES
jgi:hypothetical protein